MRTPLLISLLLVASCAPTKESTHVEKYDTTIRWTSFGIPHIKANDWESLGFGFSYAVATDAVCVLAEEVVTVNGERSKFFGDKNDKNIYRDAFHKALLDEKNPAYHQERSDEKMNDMLDGYVAGYNHYIDVNAGKLPEKCNNKPWVRHITRKDISKIAIGIGIRYGLGRVTKEIASAKPQLDMADLHPLPELIPAASLIGSNAYGIGGDLTDTGKAILLGNPHYPWSGPSRFHMAHVTIPGEIDIMGVGLYTTAFIAIGFTRDIAWTHTVSTALRFTFYQLDLKPDNPMVYEYGDESRDITSIKVVVDKLEDGKLVPVEKTIFLSHFGPIVQSAELPWDAQHAYAIRDVNYENNRSTLQYIDLAKATSVDELFQTLASHQGVFFVNTIAVDRHGNAFYGDVSSVPNVDSDMLKRCKREIKGTLNQRLVILNGSDPTCEWKNDENAAAPGIIPPDQQPSLTTRQYVTNSNDSHWLSNPNERLEGYSPIIGNESGPRSLRTRAGLVFIQEILDKQQKFSSQTVQDIMFNHRNHGAELFLDDILKACGDIDDLAEACGILGKWDRRHDISSRGAQIYTEFWGKLARTPNLYRTPFDESDPVNTPTGINIDDPEVAKAVVTALTGAVKLLGESEIPLEAPWGEVHFAERNGEKIGIPGGIGGMGMFSNIYAPRKKGGYTPIVAGNSFIQVATWNDDGDPVVKGILTYSQSQDPESAHYADQTRLYSKSEWIDLPFTDEEIKADLKKTLHLNIPK